MNSPAICLSFTVSPKRCCTRFGTAWYAREVLGAISIPAPAGCQWAQGSPQRARHKQIKKGQVLTGGSLGGKDILRGEGVFGLAAKGAAPKWGRAITALAGFQSDLFIGGSAKDFRGCGQPCSAGFLAWHLPCQRPGATAAGRHDGHNRTVLSPHV